MCAKYDDDREEVSDLYPLRTIFAFLIALSLATAPIGTAMAASSMAAKTAPAVKSSAAADMDAGMADCAKMGQKSGQEDCPCCDAKAACPPDLCYSQCMKVFGDNVQPDLVWPRLAQLRLAEGPLEPPNLIQAPQPPPPRT